jgi:hypothetical protein
MPFVFGWFFLMFIFWGGWKLFAFFPLLLLGAGVFYWFKQPHMRQWAREQRHHWRQHQWHQQDWGGKPWHNDEDDDAGYEKRKNDDPQPKRKNDSNDGDVFYV